MTSLRKEAFQSVCQMTCFCDAPTVLYEVGNGGHTWPGDEHGLPRFIVGRTSLDFDASEVIADFFGL